MNYFISFDIPDSSTVNVEEEESLDITNNVLISSNHGRGILTARAKRMLEREEQKVPLVNLDEQNVSLPINQLTTDDTPESDMQNMHLSQITGCVLPQEQRSHTLKSLSKDTLLHLQRDSLENGF